MLQQPRNVAVVSFRTLNARKICTDWRSFHLRSELCSSFDFSVRPVGCDQQSLFTAIHVQNFSETVDGSYSNDPNCDVRHRWYVECRAVHIWHAHIGQGHTTHIIRAYGFAKAEHCKWCLPWPSIHTVQQGVIYCQKVMRFECAGRSAANLMYGRFSRNSQMTNSCVCRPFVPSLMQNQSVNVERNGRHLFTPLRFCVFNSLIITRLADSREMFADISCVEFCTYQTNNIETASRIDLRSKVPHGSQRSSSHQTLSATWHHVEDLHAEFHLNRPTNVETREINLFTPLSSVADFHGTHDCLTIFL